MVVRPNRTPSQNLASVCRELLSVPRHPVAHLDRACLSTTESAFDDLRWHKIIHYSYWNANVVTTYRPDAVIDPEIDGFANNIERLGEITGEDATTWTGYLAAHRKRRAFFKTFGATASDHGHATAKTADLPQDVAARLFDKALRGQQSAEDADMFRSQMLTEMARMSLDDGLVL